MSRKIKASLLVFSFVLLVSAHVATAQISNLNYWKPVGTGTTRTLTPLNTSTYPLVNLGPSAACGAGQVLTGSATGTPVCVAGGSSNLATSSPWTDSYIPFIFNGGLTSSSSLTFSSTTGEFSAILPCLTSTSTSQSALCLTNSGVDQTLTNPGSLTFKSPSSSIAFSNQGATSQNIHFDFSPFFSLIFLSDRILQSQ